MMTHPDNLDKTTLVAALNRCAAEAIHQPGSIQPHGFLLAMDDSMIVRHASRNVTEFLGQEAEALVGMPLSHLFGDTFSYQLSSHFQRQGQDAESYTVAAQTIRTEDVRDLTGLAHLHGGLYFVEMSWANTGNQQEQFDKQFVPVRDHLWAQEGKSDLTGYMAEVARQVASLTGFERVMVYRFDSRWDGEVIAEALSADVSSYLGHHFPASDIPPQARALYLKNRIRQIVDVNAVTVEVYPAFDATGQPLDLTFSALRSFSPVHVEYLRNMGVASSLSISLVSNGRLWGLIACHHSKPLQLETHVRELVELVGRTASLKLADIERNEAESSQRRAQAALDQLLTNALPSASQLIDDSITGAVAQQLLDVLGASGAIVCVSHRKFRFGMTPDVAFLGALTDWLRTQPAGTIYATDGLPTEFPPAEQCGGIANGLLVTPVDAEMADYVMWFRPEIVQSIKWAGNPNKIIEQADDGCRVSPRKSFAAWVQSYCSHSAKWSYADIEVAQSLSLAMIAGISQFLSGRTHASGRILHDSQTLQIELALDLRYQWVTNNALDILGFSARELMGHLLIDFVFEEDIEAVNRYLIRVMVNEVPEQGIVFRHSKKDGRYLWMEFKAGRGDEGTSPVLTVSARDVTEREHYNQTLERIHRRHHHMGDIRRECIVTLDPGHRVLDANDAAHTLLGYAPGKLLGMHFCSTICDMPHCEFATGGGRQHNQHTPMIECRVGHLKRADGTSVAANIWAMRYFTSNSDENPEVMIFHPLPELNPGDPDYVEHLEKAKTENIRHGVFITDRNGTIRAVNDGFKAITGYSEAEAVGRTPALLRSNVHSRDFYKQFWRSLADQRLWRGEIWNRRKNGEVYPQLGSVYAVSPPGMNVSAHFYVAMFQDVTTSSKIDEQQHVLPEHDSLTGLPGRLLFEKRLSKEMAEGNDSFAVAFLDLNNFKAINDALGHITGDRLLYLIASRLKREMRDRDILARWGGDKFVLFLSNIANGNEATRVMQRLVRVFETPFSISGKQVSPAMNIGISLYPTDGKDVEGLMGAADTALNHAKADGAGNIHLFCEEYTANSKKRFDLANDLRAGLREHQLFLVYQPQIGTDCETAVGLEALVRWKHPVRGIVPPVEFIPVAEQSGLMVEMGEQIFELACQQIRQWLDAGLKVVPVGVNVSPMQLTPGLADFIAGMLKEYRIRPDLIEIEITESALKPTPEIRASITRIKSLGVSLAIDDFGTGYSSLSHLKLFPFDRLKIDKSFVDGLPSDPDDIAIGQAIIALGRALKVNVLAEGVEHPEQASFLKEEGVHVIQGYLFSKPLPHDQVTQFMKSMTSEPALDVLVVEDELPVQEIYRGMFASSSALKVNPRFAESGFMGLLKVGEKRPDVLITDLSMPDMDGYRMIHALHDNPETAGIPIVVVTGISLEEARAGGVPADVPVLQKPFSMDDLIAVIGEVA